MSRLSLLLAAAALLTACPGPVTPDSPDAGSSSPDAGQEQPDAGEPDAGHVEPGLLRIGGPLELAPRVTAPAHVRLAVLWFPSVDTSMPRPFAATESGPSLGQALPNRWSFDVRAEPPAEARKEVLSPEGVATGEISWGVLVAFRDVDGDGKLTIGAQGTTTDELLGSSAGAMPFDFDGPGLRTLILWRKGTVGADEPGVAQGFNLVRMSEPFARPSVFPSSMDFPLTLTADARLALMTCPAAFGEEADEFACNQRRFLTPTVSALAMSFEGFQVTTVSLAAGKRAVTDAKVTLNDVVLPRDAEGGHVLFELFPQVLLRGENTLRIEAPNHEPLELKLTFPGEPVLQTPAANAELVAGEVELVKWSPIAGATSYDVGLSVDDVGNGTYVSVATPEAQVTVPEETGNATLTLGVMAMTQLPRHSIIGTSSLAVPVKVVGPPQP